MEVPNKIQKLDSKTSQTIAKIEDLPNEIILKVLGYLDIKDLLCCGQVSKRIRTITYDESLWEKINLFNKIVPTEFLELVISNGCKYLNLSLTEIIGASFCLKKPSNLKYLHLSLECYEENNGSIHYAATPRSLISIVAIQNCVSEGFYSTLKLDKVGKLP